MSGPRTGPPLRVPTLTEVVEFAPPASARAGAAAATALVAPALPLAAQVRTAASAATPPSEEALQARVLAQLQRQLDATAESRFREALAPLLARAADGLIRELQAELATTLHGLVARAVAQELERASAAAGRDGETTPD
ncbi:MAG: hypothetical protein ABIX46_10370 [Burkholderiaceae bacterium]